MTLAPGGISGAGALGSGPPVITPAPGTSGTSSSASTSSAGSLPYPVMPPMVPPATAPKRPPLTNASAPPSNKSPVLRSSGLVCS